MSIEAVTQPASTEQRIAAIRDRLFALRDQTSVLLERAQEAATQASEIRSAPLRACNHAAQAAAMRGELDVVEHELDGLRVAMETRGVIEQAKGMLMLQRGCDADTAFSMLVSMSQTAHKKLVDVARAIVTALPAGSRAET